MELRYGTPDEVGMLPERVAYVRDLCTRWVEEGHTPTLGVCVARRGVIVLHEAFGVLGPGPDSPRLARDALFGVASLTKPLTATLVMQLVDDGLLGLNRPAKDYLPEMSGDGTDDILVHHLLTHTSGYPFEVDRPWLEHEAKKLPSGFELPPCPQDLHPDVHRWLSLFWDVPRVAPVGTMMVYSSHNYVLLGEIVRRLSGCGLEELARKRLFDPLGMHDSYYVVPDSESHRVVQRAREIPFGDRDNPFFMCLGSEHRQRLPDAGAGAYSTPRDFAVFGQMLLNRGRYAGSRVLSPAAVAAMTCDQIPGIGALFVDKVMTHGSWGYGWQVASPTKWKFFEGSLQPIGTLAHAGAGGSGVWIDLEHELVATYFEVLTHLDPDFSPRWNFDLFQNAITAAIDD